MTDISVGAVRAAEEATIHAFIRPDRRERWLNALDSPSRRKKTVRLFDTRDFDERWAQALTGADNDRESVRTLLRSLGAPDDCLLMEELPEPTKALSLDAALRAVFDEGQWGSLIICVPGRLAYQKLEESLGGVLFQRG